MSIGTILQLNRPRCAEGRLRRASMSLPRWRRARLLATGSVLLLCSLGSGQVHGNEYTWSASLNGNAENWSSNQTNHQITFPVLGDVTVGATSSPGPYDSGYDDFCFVGGTRTYSTYACKTEYKAHRGADIMPVAGTPAGELPVVAAIPGTVHYLGCTDGGGRTVEIRNSSSTLFVHTIHLNSFAAGLSQGAVVGRGQLIGTMGTSTNTSCTGLTALHTHFEIRSGGDDSYNHARDPWVSLRNSYAWIGRGANGTSFDQRFLDAYLIENANYPSQWLGMTYIGWPGVWTTGTSENVFSTTSSYGTTGTKQYLTTYHQTYSSSRRSGVIIARNGGPTAYLVPREVYSVYLISNEQAGWLGFPTSQWLVSISKQYFEGGCIRHNGSTFVASTYASGYCN